MINKIKINEPFDDYYYCVCKAVVLNFYFIFYSKRRRLNQTDSSTAPIADLNVSSSSGDDEEQEEFTPSLLPKQPQDLSPEATASEQTPSLISKLCDLVSSTDEIFPGKYIPLKELQLGCNYLIERIVWDEENLYGAKWKVTIRVNNLERTVYLARRHNQCDRFNQESLDKISGLPHKYCLKINGHTSYTTDYRILEGKPSPFSVSEEAD